MADATVSTAEPQPMRESVAKVAAAIDAVLPQTQCGACDYPACRPYADAVAAQQAPINHCPPGGDRVVRLLSQLTSQPVLPLREPARPPMVVSIREVDCIGCTLCIQACPVDAIVGAARQMHSVIAAECNGCERCIPPCPVDCIESIVLPARSVEQTTALAVQWRRRFEAREVRLAAEPVRRAQRMAERRRAHAAATGTAAAEATPAAEPSTQTSTTPDGQTIDRRAVLQAAIARLRQRPRDSHGN